MLTSHRPILVPHNLPQFTTLVNDQNITTEQWLDELFSQGQANGSCSERKPDNDNFKEWLEHRVAETEAIRELVKAEILRRFAGQEKELASVRRQLSETERTLHDYMEFKSKRSGPRYHEPPDWQGRSE